MPFVIILEVLILFYYIDYLEECHRVNYYIKNYIDLLNRYLRLSSEYNELKIEVS